MKGQWTTHFFFRKDNGQLKHRASQLPNSHNFQFLNTYPMLLNPFICEYIHVYIKIEDIPQTIERPWIFSYRVINLDWEKVLSFFSPLLLLTGLEFVFFYRTMFDIFCIKILSTTSILRKTCFFRSSSNSS